MKFLLVVAALAVSCYAKPQNYFYSAPAFPYAYGALPYSALPYSTVAHAAAPVVAAPLLAASKYHAQDVLGQVSFGHAEPLQSRAEVRDAIGNVRGSYSYYDPNGKLNVVEYSAGQGGFRVLGANNLPEAPAVPETPELKAPEPVQDTPEVVAARADFAKKFAEAATAAAEDRVPEVTVSRRRRGVAVLPAVAHPVVLPALAKSTIKYSTFEPVDAPTPAATKKLELTEKEHEVITPVAYSAPAFYAAPAPVKLVAEDKAPITLKTISPVAYNYGYHYGYPYFV